MQTPLATTPISTASPPVYLPTAHNDRTRRTLMNFRSKSAKLALIPLMPLAALGTVAFTNGGPAGASTAIKVKAIETDFHIALSQKTFKAGTYTFVTVNKGKTTH